MKGSSGMKQTPLIAGAVFTISLSVFTCTSPTQTGEDRLHTPTVQELMGTWALVKGRWFEYLYWPDDTTEVVEDVDSSETVAKYAVITHDTISEYAFQSLRDCYEVVFQKPLALSGDTVTGSDWQESGISGGCDFATTTGIRAGDDVFEITEETRAECPDMLLYIQGYTKTFARRADVFPPPDWPQDTCID
jgi:hypothetical protein